MMNSGAMNDIAKLRLIKEVDSSDIKQAIELVNAVFSEFVAVDYSEQGQAAPQTNNIYTYDEAGYVMEGTGFKATTFVRFNQDGDMVYSSKKASLFTDSLCFFSIKLFCNSPYEYLKGFGYAIMLKSRPDVKDVPFNKLLDCVLFFNMLFISCLKFSCTAEL